MSSGGVGIYISSNLNYNVIETTSTEAFQAIWVEVQFIKKSNIICGVIYQQHNSPEQFQSYFDDTLEKLSTHNKPVYVMGDFNIDLLKSETCGFSHNFLLSLQSFSFVPTIDKPTRVYNNSATLIDNIFANRIDGKVSSGNIVSDISDHYSQFALFHSPRETQYPKRCKIRDYSNFSQDAFNTELLKINLETRSSLDKSFSCFYNKLNKLVNKHAPLKNISRKKAKQLTKPWISRSIRKSIKIKNALFISGDTEKYKLYKNKLLSLTRLSKKLYYHTYFEENLNNTKKTWEGINQLINWP